MRVLADLLFHPPINEAKTIILENSYITAKRALLKYYRSIPNNRPLFVCQVCSKRFCTKKQLGKHVSKGEYSVEHRRFYEIEKIHRAQQLFLQRVKKKTTGIYFPAYYELVPTKKFFKENSYSIQILDKIGAAGRPIGVVEEKRTIRTLDAYGEYLQVLIDGQLGWIQYRIKNLYRMRPVCEFEPGFNWNTLHVQESLTYYRVNDRLPKETALKVYYRPLLGSEVCGYLKRTQVIECLAVIGEWLQVRYDKEEAAWVRWCRYTGNTEANVKKKAFHVKKSKGTSKPISPPPQPQSQQAEGIENDAFDDGIIVYEIDGRKYKVEKKADTKITTLKLRVFDEIRFGLRSGVQDEEQEEDLEKEKEKEPLLVLLPTTLHRLLKERNYEHSVAAHKDGTDLSKESAETRMITPCVLTQRELFDMVMDHDLTDYECDEEDPLLVQRFDNFILEDGDRSTHEEDLLDSIYDEEYDADSLEGFVPDG